MEMPPVPQDDLMDVMEMTEKLENYITSVLRDNDKNLAMSALMSATINCMLGPCKTLDEVMLYRNIFIEILDGTIRTIKVKGPGKTS